MVAEGCDVEIVELAVEVADFIVELIDFLFIVH